MRAINVYGDPAPWVTHPLPLRTLLSFLNTTKYPPSLSFLLMTLGPALILLAWLERKSLSKSNPLIVFGRVPLFYFVVHFFLAHALAVAMAILTYGGPAWTFMWQPYPRWADQRRAFRKALATTSGSRTPCGWRSSRRCTRPAGASRVSKNAGVTGGSAICELVQVASRHLFSWPAPLYT